MTVLVGAISETCEVAIASDSLQWSESGNSSGGLWKTLRINDRCAVGFSGNGTYGGQVAAILMGKPEWAEEAGEVDLLKRIEEAGIQRDQWSCAGVRTNLNTILFDLAKTVKGRTGKLPDVNVVFVGKDNRKAYLSQWFPHVEAERLWGILHVTGTSFVEAQLMAFGPEEIEGPKALIKDISLTFMNRVLTICKLYAGRFPEKVNREFWIREDCSSFVRSPLGVGSTKSIN